jgi:hypothetical protein
MPALVGLGVHAVSYWGAFWLLHLPLSRAAFLCYAAGAALLVAGVWYPKFRLGNSQAIQVVGYSVLLAVLLFGANRARDILGNSVRVNRLHQLNMEPHFLLAPGVTSVGLGALVTSLLRRAASREA